ncbi:MAG: hypothetical protein WC595_04395 [Candidatus Nanoarchaeia archaeon]
MNNEVYVTDTVEIVDKIMGSLGKTLTELEKSVKRAAKVPEDAVILSYGEQPDPPIIKNTGKSILAEAIKRKLKSRGVESINLHDVLYNDVFGSNAEVFKAFGLSAADCEKLGKQTYGAAPATPKYQVKMLDKLMASIPDGAEIGFLKTKMLESFPARPEESIGSLNIQVRRKLEGVILPFEVEYRRIDEIESRLVHDEDSFNQLLSFSGLEGKMGPGHYVLAEKPTESGDDRGTRRYFVTPKLEIIHPISRVVIGRVGNRRELTYFGGYRGISLDASSRAILTYALAKGGLGITGGGSEYNTRVALEYVARGNAMPLLAHISNKAFETAKGFPLTALLGKKEVVEKAIGMKGRNYFITTTGDNIFAQLVGGIKQ